MIDRTPRNFIRDIAHSVVVPGSRVVRSPEVAHIGDHQSHSHAQSADAPAIELVTEDGIVRAIDVTCGCGQKMRLWCSYETTENGPNSATP